MLRELRMSRALDRANAIEAVILDHPALTWRAVTTTITPGRQMCLIRAEGPIPALAALRDRYVKHPPREAERVSLVRDAPHALEWIDVERSGIAETDISALIYEELGGEVAIELRDDIHGRHWRLLTPRPEGAAAFVARLKEHESEMRVRQRAIPAYEIRSFATPDAASAEAADATLTDLERTLLRTAVGMGYYAHPRRASVRDVAERLGMPPSTAHRWLRRAEAKAMAAHGAQA